MGNRMFVATRKGLFTVSASDPQAAKSWAVQKAEFLGDPLTYAMHDARSGWLYAAIKHGHFGPKLHRSTDGGETWEEIGVPVYPEPPADREPDKCPVRGTPIKWSLDMMWVLAPGGANEPGVLWCGTLPGGLFRSEDHGATWSLVRSLWDRPERKEWFGGGYDLPGIHSIEVHPRDHRQVTIGISCGGVWLTRDGGKSWECRATGMRAAFMPPERQYDPNIQDPHCLVACRAHPEVLWAQHHNGIFRSTNGGASWEELTSVQPSSFGFAAAAHPSDPNTAWFVPGISDERRVPVDGRVVVTRTRDGGKTFDVLGEGLPPRFSYDIAFRHALDVDETGRRLAFGSTTGGLWISTDSGDSWRLISAHLPPIHSVRFEKAQ